MGMCKLCIYTRVNWLQWTWGPVPSRLSSVGLWSKRKTRVNMLNYCKVWLITNSCGGALIKKGFGMWSIVLWDTVLEVEPHSSLWKLLSGVLKPKKLDFPAMKIPGLPTELAYFRSSTWLIWLGIYSLIMRLFQAFKMLLDRNAQILTVKLVISHCKAQNKLSTIFFIHQCTMGLSLLLQLFLAHSWRETWCQWCTNASNKNHRQAAYRCFSAVVPTFKKTCVDLLIFSTHNHFIKNTM